MPTLTGAQAIVASLQQHGVDTLFALPGGQLDHFFDAVYPVREEIQLVHTRHEQGAAYMAYGYARSTGRTGVFAVVPGPGLLNCGAALCTAWGNSAPVLCISGQIPLRSIGRGYGELHEIDDQLGMISHICKQAERIDHPALAPDAVARAMAAAAGGRPRPVEIEMPMDVMGAAAEVTLTGPAPQPLPPVDANLIDQAAAALAGAKRPLIVVGSGALGAAAEINALAGHLQAPVGAKRSGKGIVSAKHYLSANMGLTHRLWGEADVVLAVGTRIKEALTMWGKDDDLTLIRVDIDPQELTKICVPEIGIVGDAASVVGALNDALSSRPPAASREPEMTALRATIDADIRAAVGPQMAYLDVIRDVLPDDGIFVDEITQCGFASWYGFPVYAPRQHVTAGEMGTLGFGFATAIGVAVGNPDKKVVQISGDGGFMFTMQELATAVHHQVNLVTVIFNDNTFGNVQRQQDEWFGGRRLGSDLTNPDFAAMAETFGATGMRAADPLELRAALEKAFTVGGPVIIEVPVGERMPSPWKFIIMEQNRKQLCT